MRINWLGVVIATVVVFLLRYFWNAHLGGADTGHLVGKVMSDIQGNHNSALLALGNSLVLSVGLGWLIGSSRDRSLMTGIFAGLGACIFFAATSISGDYVKAGVFAGAPLHAFGMQVLYLVVTYVLAGAILGAMAPKR